MNLRQGVAFAILMGADMYHIAPVYALEKVRSCNNLAVPEVLLDEKNRAKFKAWVERWGMDWDAERDLKRPIVEVLEQEE